MSIDLKTLTPDLTIPPTAVFFGADSQTAATPSVYPLSNLKSALGIPGPYERSGTAPVAGGMMVVSNSGVSVFNVSLTEDVTTMMINVDPKATQKDVMGITLCITSVGSHTIAWPSEVKWPAGAAPQLTANKTDILTLVSWDVGTTWYGFVSGQGY